MKITQLHQDLSVMTFLRKKTRSQQKVTLKNMKKLSKISATRLNFVQNLPPYSFEDKNLSQTAPKI